MPDLSDPAFAGPLSVNNWGACSQSAQCGAMDIPTPNTNHQDETEIVLEREEVIGEPVMQATPSKIDLASTASSQGKATVAVSNGGSGVLAFRVSVTAPWIKVSRTQGIALGSDIGVRTSSFVVEPVTAGLPQGVYKGDVVIESLYAGGGPKKISVTITNYPSGALIAGSGPEVYLMKGGVRRWVPNRATLEANGLTFKVLTIPDSTLGSIPLGDPLHDVLGNGNLIAGGGPEIYVMEGGRKRHVTSRTAMEACGYAFADVRSLTNGTVQTIAEGAPLDGPPCPRLKIPEGRLVKGSSSAVYVSRGGLKRHVPNAATFEAYGYNWANIDTVGDSLLAGVATGVQLQSVLANGTLLKNSGGSIYVVSGGGKRLIGGPTVMAACGYSGDAAYTLSVSRLNTIPDIVPLVAPPCPRLSIGEGRLIEGSGTAVYVMRQGIKRHVPDPATFEANGFLWGNIDTLPNAVVSGITTGDPLLSVLADGNLIRGSGDAVYVMQSGARRPVGPAVMSQCGYGTDAVRTISDGRLAAIPLGVALLGTPCVAFSVPSGALVAGSGPEVYAVQGGQRRHILSRDAFEACGYRWGDVNKLPASMLAMLPAGPGLSGPPCP
jgi:hypothetical protein